MLCERCKIREANIQYTEIVNGVKTEHNFCAQCAKELDFGPYSAIFDSDFPLGKLLSGLLGVGEVHEEQKTCQVVCPTCKTSYDEFIKDSRFGCPDCYGVFDLLISDNIKQLQGSDCHKGKKPLGQKQKQEQGADAAASGEREERIAPGEELLQMKADGDRPAQIREELRILEARLKEALKREEYETAARCRDKIKELRGEIEAC